MVPRAASPSPRWSTSTPPEAVPSDPSLPLSRQICTPSASTWLRYRRAPVAPCGRPWRPQPTRSPPAAPTPSPFPGRSSATITSARAPTTRPNRRSASCWRRKTTPNGIPCYRLPRLRSWLPGAMRAAGTLVRLRDEPVQPTGTRSPRTDVCPTEQRQTHIRGSTRVTRSLREDILSFSALRSRT